MYYEAVSQDDAYADMMLKEYGIDSAPYKGPRMSQYSVQVEQLMNIQDLLQAISLNVMRGYAKKGSVPQFKPIKRPETAIERAKQRRGWQIYHHLEERFFPGRIKDKQSPHPSS